MKKTGSFFMSFIPIILLIGIQIVVSIPAMIIYAFKDMPGEFDLNYFLSKLTNSPSDQAFTMLVSILYAVVGILIFGIWYNYLRKKEKRKNILKFNPQRILSMFFLAIALVIFIQIAIQFLFAQWPDLETSYSQVIDALGLNDVHWYVILYAVVLAPICEELAFRGATLYFADKALPFWFANILQAALFGILHMNLVQGLYAFVIGLVFGLVYRKGGRIWFCIILHIIYNIFGAFFSNLFVFNTYYGWAIGIAVGLLLIWGGIKLFAPEKY